MEHTIFLVGDEPAVAEVIQEAIAGTNDGPFFFDWVRKLSAGVEVLKTKAIAAVFLDLSLPDCQGFRSFIKLSQAVPDVPILILAGQKDEEVAREAPRGGAYDFLLKDHLDRYPLTRALHSLIARKAAEEEFFVEKERAQVTLNSMGNGVIASDIAGNISWFGEYVVRRTGICI